MNIVFIGPPYAGKGTQAMLLGKALGLPVYSIGALIREAYERKDPRAVKGFEEYSMKGLHVPIELKFPLLEEKMNESRNGFILDNFPGTPQDLRTLLNYLRNRNLEIDKAFYIPISEGEVQKRMKSRGRKDDDPRIVATRRIVQDKDRIPVIKYFRSQGLLEEIDGERAIETVHQDILGRLKE